MIYLYIKNIHFSLSTPFTKALCPKQPRPLRCCSLRLRTCDGVGAKEIPIGVLGEIVRIIGIFLAVDPFD